MTEQDLTPLLHRSESESLDFKRDAYPFSGATDDVKSELLKDVIAFANARRDSDAWIIIGVEEENGRVKRIPGAAITLRDHDVQQFINSKTNRRIDFNIEILSHAGVSLTIIKIWKVQARPIFLLQDFGRLKKEIVYIRRGSSTGEASLDEVADMGREEVRRAEAARPEIVLRFAFSLETWRNQDSLGMRIRDDATEVTVLKVIAVNTGVALAQYVQGSVSLPYLLLWEYRSSLGKRSISLADVAKSHDKTLVVSNKLSDPTGSIFIAARPPEWKPLLPETELCLMRERLIPLAERVRELDCSIRWKIGADNCSPKIGETKFSEIRILDRRR